MDYKAANDRKYLWNEIQLIEQITNVVESYNHLEYGDNTGDYIKIAAAYPDYVFDTTDQANVQNSPHKLICYDISRKEDGSIGESMNSNKKHPRPVLIKSYDAVINQGQEDEKKIVEEVYSKRYDIIYRFDCLAPSDMESMILIRNFERMMEIHAQYLELGSHRFIYKGRRASYFNRDTQYKSRSCEFFAQVEEQWYKHQDRIDKITVEYLSKTRLR